MEEKQCTIQRKVSVTGAGLHTRQCGTLTFNPAPVNTGIRFRRIDLENRPIIEADVDNVIDTARGTTLGKGGVKLYTVEHVLASLRGMGVDNVLIDIDVEEMPIMDGSGKEFVKAIKEAGIVEQNAPRNYYVIKEPITYRNEVLGIELSVEPCDTFQVDVTVKYNTRVLDKQSASLHDLKDFESEIAPCRTFVFLHELETLLSRNLIKGGDLTNAIVFVNKNVSPEELDHIAQFFKKPKVEVREGGTLNNVDLYFENEPARHKLLDVIGDLTLIGKPIKGHVKAYKPGHFSNTAFARAIKQAMLQQE
ncbi:MAG: UDP-3-O-[Bacteroidales bacterium]|jgi:UDP-3-O-[3-hydroxymyristoyl] N-acetylglucosamine deacetylase/3-hydroxyacyl-[acyl-carrier-protein] dehydratase|nr:UDP-3-O-[3-hydroxymyristoyl] N-acetylglucosamine deacetylase [Bacteroidales bacterium]MBR6847070.1 UDP-3-O-[3-hydroxymyristoyl] N-acetylglucosamine deacetylase [Bacteroidales bacterium]